MLIQISEGESTNLIETGLELIVQGLESSERWTIREMRIHSQLSVLLIRNPGLGGRGTTSLRGRLLALGTRSIIKKGESLQNDEADA